MRTLILFIFWIATITTNYAQDHYAVVIQNEETTYNYPKNTHFTLYDKHGIPEKIEEGQSIRVVGDYRLEADVYWKETPDVIESDGGMLEVFILPKEDSNYKKKHSDESHDNPYEGSKEYSQPYLEKKEISISENKEESYNGLFVFSNGMVFKFDDGAVRAYENGEELKIEARYIVTGKNEVLKISFNPKNGEMWYVFEKNQ